MRKKIKLFLFLGFSLIAYHSFSQSSVMTCGASEVGQGGFLSYSIGICYANYSADGTFSVTEGTQQQYSEVAPDRVADIAEYDKCFVYPNPTTDKINIVSNQADQPIQYSLYTEQGTLLERNVFTNTCMISLKPYPTSIYFVVLAYQDKKQIMKIIKK